MLVSSYPFSFCLLFFAQKTFYLSAQFDRKERRDVACSKRSDSGERYEVKKAMKSRGGTHLSPSLTFIFSRSF